MAAELHEPDFARLDTLDYPLIGTSPVPVEAYTSPEYFERERDAIFSKAWMIACHESEIAEPGDYIVKNIGILRASIILARGPDRAVRGYHNVCTHRGSPLVPKACQGRAPQGFICRFHGWAFGIDGQLKGVSDARHYFDLDEKKLGLVPVSVEVWKGWVFFNPETQPRETLRAYLGTMAEALEEYPSETLTLVASWHVDAAVNWKLFLDGFQEAYHAATVHEATVPFMYTWKENPFGRHSYFKPHGRHRKATISMNPKFEPSQAGLLAGELLTRRPALDGEARVRTPSKGLNPDRVTSFAFDINGFFPNTLLNLFLGSALRMEFIPTAVDKTHAVVKVYAEPYENFSQKLGLQWPILQIREAVLEDLPVLEATQRGLASGAIKEIHYSDGELALRHQFHVVDAMVNGRPIRC